VANLHIDITGDCTGATNALANTRSAIEGLQGATASVGVTVAGASSAISDMDRVGTSVRGVSSTAAINIDDSAVTAARGNLQGLGSEVRATSREMASVGSMTGFGANASEIGRMSNALGTATQALQGYAGASESAMGRVSAANSDFAESSRAVSNAGSDMESTFGGAERAARSMHAEVEQGTARLEQHANAMARVNSMAGAGGGGGGENAPGTWRSLEGGGAAYRLTPEQMAARRAGTFDPSSVPPRPGTGGPPKPPQGPPPGGGGSGGGGGGGGDDEQARFDREFQKQIAAEQAAKDQALKERIAGMQGPSAADQRAQAADAQRMQEQQAKDISQGRDRAAEQAKLDPRDQASAARYSQGKLKDQARIQESQRLTGPPESNYDRQQRLAKEAQLSPEESNALASARDGLANEYAKGGPISKIADDSDMERWQQGIGRAGGGTGGPPPDDPMSKWGRSGGSKPPPGWGGAGRGGRTPKPPDPISEGLDVGGQLGAPAMMGGMIGLASVAVTGAVGLGSVLETIKHMPAAMFEAKQATSQFGWALSAATAGASVDEQVFQSLGTALHGLGGEVGAVGIANMNTAVNAATGLAGTATTALHNLAPAIGPAITALGGLGEALMTGFSSPEAVQSIKSASDALSKPENKQGVTDTVAGIVGASAIITQVVADTLGAVDKATGGGPGGSTAVTGGVGAAFLGKSLLKDLFGGGAAGTAKALGVGGALGTIGFGGASWEQSHGMGEAVTPSVIGEGIGATLLGIISGGNPAAIVAGGAVGFGIGAATSETAPKDTVGGRALNLGGSAFNLIKSLATKTPMNLTPWSLPKAYADVRAKVGDLGQQWSTFVNPDGSRPGAPTAPGSSAFDPGSGQFDAGPAAAPGPRIPGPDSPAAGAGEAPTGPPPPPSRPSPAMTEWLRATRIAGEQNKPLPGPPPLDRGGLPAAGQTPDSPYNAGSPSFGQFPSIPPPKAAQPAAPPPDGVPIDPLNSPDHNYSDPGMPSTVGDTTSTPSRIAPPSPPPRVGPGSSGMPMSTQGLSQLNVVAGSTTATMGQLGQRTAVTAQSLMQTSQGANMLAPAVSMAGQNSAQAATQISQVNKSATTAATSVSTLGTSTSAAMAPLAQLMLGAPKAISQASSVVASGGQQIGNTAASSVAKGATNSTPQACDAAGAMGKCMVAIAQSTLQMHSPSGVFIAIGESTGQGMAIGAANSAPGAASAVGAMAGAAIAGAYSATAGIASNAGLAVGFMYAANVATGMQSVFQTSAFQAMGFPKMDSPAGQLALGLQNLLGPAGAGAESYKFTSPEVSLPAGGSGQPIMITNQVLLDGTVFDTKVATQIANAFNQATNMISQQAG